MMESEFHPLLFMFENPLFCFTISLNYFWLLASLTQIPAPGIRELGGRKDPNHEELCDSDIQSDEEAGDTAPSILLSAFLLLFQSPAQ